MPSSSEASPLKTVEEGEHLEWPVPPWSCDYLLVGEPTRGGAGDLTSAFRLFLSAAKRGDSSSQINLGNFYSAGIGVKRNRERALYWYRRAYRQGERAAASNIGSLLKGEKQLNQALAWFERAVNLNDGDANLEIANIYLRRNDKVKAKRYLREVGKASAHDVTDTSKEQAQKLLKRLEREVSDE